MSSTRSVAVAVTTDDVLVGLMAERKTLPCRLLYDARGAALFEQICQVDEYYPTRSEVALLRETLPALAAAVGPEVRVIEPGSGEGVKTRMLLGALDRPTGYVPIDVSQEQLRATAAAFRKEFAGLEVQPCCADFAGLRSLPPPTRRARRSLVFFPGSTIGNFEPAEARSFLARFGALAGRGGLLLLGADANDDVPALLAAYGDAAGVTAAFNRNVLAHINSTHAATFDLDSFDHRAVWDPASRRIEMHLVSRRAQTVCVAGQPICFAPGEPIVTEHCYKHDRQTMAAFLSDAGWNVQKVWPDPQRRMHLWLAEWSEPRLASR